MLNKSGIYKIRNVVNGKCYIGSAVNFKNRWRLHNIELRLDRHHSPKLQNAWNKYREGNFKFEIICFCNKEELIKLEQFYIDSLKSDYNICKVAGSTLGHKLSKEAREKISKAKKGKKTRPCPEYIKVKIGIANKGKLHSEETKLKLSEINKGKKLSEEIKLKISKSNKGRLAANKGSSLSIETREKISVAGKGRKFSDIHKQRISESKMGKKLSDGHKAKISRTGKKHSVDTIFKIIETRRLNKIKHIESFTCIGTF